MEKGDIDKEILVKATDAKKLRIGMVVAIIILSAALTLVSVLGSVYVYKWQSHCTSAIQASYQEKYQIYNEDHTVKDVDVDRQHHIERLTTRDRHGNPLLVTVLDYHKRLISMYNSEMEECYMLGGIVEQLGSFDNSVKLFTGENMTAGVMSFVYKVSDESSVYDTSLLPSELLPHCSHGNLYWMERKHGGQDALREKRRADIEIEFYCRCCPLRCGVRVRPSAA